MVDVEWLANELIDVQILCHRVGARGAADRYDLRPASRAAILIEELHAVHPTAQIKIEEDDVGLSHLDLAQSKRAARRGGNLVAGVTKRELQHPDGGVLVLDDENERTLSSLQTTGCSVLDARLLRRLPLELVERHRRHTLPVVTVGKPRRAVRPTAVVIGDGAAGLRIWQRAVLVMCGPTSVRDERRHLDDLSRAPRPPPV